MTTRLILDQMVEPAAARVLVRRAAGGQVIEARFDLSGLPRVDSLLTGRPVASLPSLIEHLCGVCPAAHHLAGVAALESLWGIDAIPPAAQHLRRLLHHGSVLEVHAARFGLNQPLVQPIKALGKAAARAAGSPGHFPTTAVVGGARQQADPTDIGQLERALPDALSAARQLAHQMLDASQSGTDRPDTYKGANLALVDDAGTLDPLGPRLGILDPSRTQLADAATPSTWDDTVAMALADDPAPRPYLRRLGPDLGGYRVGPAAALRVAAPPPGQAAALRAEWLAGPGGPLAARAIMALSSVEAIATELDLLDPSDSDLRATTANTSAEGVGVGWVDGARGLLVHRYEAAPGGTVRAGIVLTPTAQNEPWLAQLLTEAIGQNQGPEAVALAEQAIRDVDPCLPCSAAPPGQMHLEILDQPAGS
ncbi:MAG: nickel-dependent hydrogenase large subunit [Bifidobacteriaceae bacterium]|jgi:NAD-reducing hydrogenase large subunit|nr:nickel-dependent hydrogenase large subunit [Bifidobacteriaceae bacterium]